MRNFVFGFMVLVGGTLTAAERDQAGVKLLAVKKIWDKAPHSAFTDLIRFQGKWFCSFREGDGHAAGAGTCRVLVSEDGETWESAASLAQNNVDLRDPKLSITPDGRLMMVGGAAEPALRNPLKDHYSFVSFSKDGKTWDTPQRVLGSWQWLWRVTWHKDKAYGVSYNWDPQTPNSEKHWTATLYQSADGIKYEKLADFDVKNATEASLAFEGDRMICLLRRDGTPNTAMLGTSTAPYKEWQWQDLGAHLGGPQLIRLPNGSWWAAGRNTLDKKTQTVLCRLYLDKGKLEPVLPLPSAGDNSYPGLVWHDKQLWISYYSSHEDKKTSIFLARVQLMP